MKDDLFIAEAKWPTILTVSKECRTVLYTCTGNKLSNKMCDRQKMLRKIWKGSLWRILRNVTEDLVGEFMALFTPN